METITENAEIRVCIDVGCKNHSVAIGMADGTYLDSFDITHDKPGFDQFFDRISAHEERLGYPVAIAMEGYNGYARPLDQLILSKQYRLYNVNNLKLARFKEIFPTAAKTDSIDARKGLELFQLQQSLPLAKGILQQVEVIDKNNQYLKRYTRRRDALVKRRVSVVNSLQSDIQAVCPGLLDITKDVCNQWFLNFLSSADDLRKLVTKRHKTLVKIKLVGPKYAKEIQSWQKSAHFSDEVDIVGPMILEDIKRVIELTNAIKSLETTISKLIPKSEMATILDSIPGFGLITCGTLAGEIGSIQRFEKESSLAFYLGMAALSNNSGNYKGTKTPRHINKRAKTILMTAVDRHRTCVPESQEYYNKKRKEGKTHNQAIRSLGRHLCRVIFMMLRDKKTYEIKP